MSISSLPRTRRVYHFTSAEHAASDLEAHRLKISELKGLNDPFELLAVDLTDPEIREGVMAFLERISAARGLLCFSRAWNDPVMWAHYSNRHHGACLGFDVADNLTKDVRYVEKRVPIEEWAPNRTVTRESAETILWTKYKSWEYEQEVRVWGTLDERTDGHFFQDFNEQMQLAELIIGYRCSGPDRDRLRHAASSYPRLEIIEARPSLDEFRIVRGKDVRAWR